MDANIAKSERLRALLPDIWELIRPRRYSLLLGLALIAVNRVAGLVLPASTKYLIDDVIGKRNTALLTPLVLAVLGATMLQGVTSFTLTQLLSKAAHRLIADLRRKVQRHVGRLPVAYYDANKTGTLVSRIMTDVEGMRNLVGTGLVELIGGLLTAAIAFVLLMRISPLLTGISLALLLIFALFLRKAFKTIRPIFRERGKINAEVTGRLTESLGGVRVVKGYHAEEREAAVFSQGAQRLLDNVLKSMTGMSLMSLSATLLMGVVGGVVMFAGARQIFAGTLTLGGFVTFTAFLAFLVAPVFQTVSIGTQLTEAIAGLERTREVLREQPEDADPRRTRELPSVEGTVRFDDVSFAYEAGKSVLHGISFEAQPGTVTALVGSSGSGKSTMIGLLAAFYVPDEGTVYVDGLDLSTVRLDSYRVQLGVVLQETFLFDGTIRENVGFARPDATEEQIRNACRIAHVDEFAERFDLAYDTVVGERGVKLSGGQRQRVAIAPRDPGGPAHSDSRRSDIESRFRIRGEDSGGALLSDEGTHDLRDRAPALDHPARGPDPCGGGTAASPSGGTHESLYAAEGRYWDLYTKQHGLETNLFLAPGEGDGVEPVAS